MTGKYRHGIDSKGRLAIPARLRDELGAAFYVTIGLEHSLMILTEAGFTSIVEKMRSLPMAEAQKLRFFFANALRCEPDKQGRFLLPGELREYAGLKQEVMFIGLGNHAEIWDANAYQRLENETLTPENLAAVMEELGF